jgi:hypothetical protein
VLHPVRQKLGILARQQGQWHAKMERLSAAEVSWAEAKGMWWSPRYAGWWAERQAWHARRKRLWQFFGRLGVPPADRPHTYSGPHHFNLGPWRPPSGPLRG